MSHPTAYALEAYSAGALTGAEEAALRPHVEGCGACTRQLAGLQASASAFRSTHPPERFFARADRANRARRRRGAAAVLAMAASVALVAGWALRPSDTLTARGTGGVRYFVARQGAVEEQQAPLRVTEGDALRVEVSAARRAWVCAFFLDAEGNVSWYVPAPGQTEPWVLEPGTAALPGSAVFDASSTPELLVVAQRPEPFSPAQLAQSVRQAWLSQRGVPFESSAWLPPEPGLSSSLVLKRPP